MFCPLCGTGYDEIANFCKRCGKAFTDSDKKEGHHSDLNIQQSDSGEMSTTQPLSFKAYMESRNVSKCVPSRCIIYCNSEKKGR